MMSTFIDLKRRLVGIVRDDSARMGKLDDAGNDGYDQALQSALDRFQQHRPDLKVVDIAGNGGSDYDLPAGWVDGFSAVVGIEYPIGDVPESLLERAEYAIYQTPAAKKLRLLTMTPAGSESFRVTYTIARSYTTIAAADTDAFCYLAASFCLEAMANSFSQTGDSLIAADSVDHKSKAADCAMRAKRMLSLYKEHMGIKDDDVARPASSVADVSMNYPGGADRLTHPRRARRQR